MTDRVSTISACKSARVSLLALGSIKNLKRRKTSFSASLRSTESNFTASKIYFMAFLKSTISIKIKAVSKRFRSIHAPKSMFAGVSAPSLSGLSIKPLPSTVKLNFAKRFSCITTKAPANSTSEKILRWISGTNDSTLTLILCSFVSNLLKVKVLPACGCNYSVNSS